MSNLEVTVICDFLDCWKIKKNHLQPHRRQTKEMSSWTAGPLMLSILFTRTLFAWYPLHRVFPQLKILVSNLKSTVYVLGRYYGSFWGTDNVLHLITTVFILQIHQAIHLRSVSWDVFHISIKYLPEKSNGTCFRCTYCGYFLCH